MLYVMEISEKKLKIVISSAIEHIADVIDDAVDFLDNAGREYDLFSLKLVIAEGLANSIKHGNQYSPHHNTVFTVDVSSPQLIMSFEDQGEGFDWKESLQREMPRENQVSGRGLLLIKEYGYNVRYNEKGNKMYLIYG